MKDQQRRKFTRVRFDVPVVITVDDIVLSVKELCNLSIGGALISCEQDFADLTKCTVQIPMGDITNNLSIEIQGEFVWSNDTEAAIKFTSIDPDSLMLLQNIIRYNAEDADKIDSEIANHMGIK